MKLDFTFDSELASLTEEKTNAKASALSSSMSSAAITNIQSPISPSTAELNLKIASVKKVRQEMEYFLLSQMYKLMHGF